MVDTVRSPLFAVSLALALVLGPLASEPASAFQVVDGAHEAGEETPPTPTDEDAVAEAESDDPATHVHDEIVVTGTRARQRSITESMAPRSTSTAASTTPGRPAGKGAAGSCDAEAAGFEHVDCKSRDARLRAAPRPRVRSSRGM